MTTRLSETDVRELLSKTCTEAGGVNAFARMYHVSPAYVSSALSGKRTFGPKILKALSLKRVTSYEWVKA